MRTRTSKSTEPTARSRGPLPTGDASALPVQGIFERMSSDPRGLASSETMRRLADVGPNPIRTHHARPLAVLTRQFLSAFLLLLLVAALVSAFLGQGTDALIIGAILALSVGLGFVNEYRAERAVEALHEEIRHDVPALRDGRWSKWKSPTSFRATWCGSSSA